MLGAGEGMSRLGPSCSNTEFGTEGLYRLYSLQKPTLNQTQEGKTSVPSQFAPFKPSDKALAEVRIWICLLRAEGSHLPQHIAIPQVNIGDGCTYVQSFSECCNYIYLPALACNFFFFFFVVVED